MVIPKPCLYFFFSLSMVSLNIWLIFTSIGEIDSGTKKWKIKILEADKSLSHIGRHSQVKYQMLMLIDSEVYPCILISLGNQTHSMLWFSFMCHVIDCNLLICFICACICISLFKSLWPSCGLNSLLTWPFTAKMVFPLCKIIVCKQQFLAKTLIHGAIPCVCFVHTTLVVMCLSGHQNQSIESICMSSNGYQIQEKLFRKF